MSRFILVSILVRMSQSTEISTFQINLDKNTAIDQILDIKLEPEIKANLQIHGCWCPKLLQNGVNSDQTGGDPVDELDTICKRWVSDRNCNDKLIGGLCFESDLDLGSNFYEVNVNADTTECNSNGFSSCELSTGR